VGRRSELATMAHSARKVLVTCETIYERDLTASDDLAPATIRAMFVTALSHQPNGSWPLKSGADRPEDAAHLREYARLAKTDEGFAQYLSRYVVNEAAAEPA